MNNKIIMSVRPLSKHLQEVAVSELNEVPTRLQDDIQFIVEWAKKQPHLNIRTDAQWIAAFLRGSKFSFEKTKRKLDMYYTMRSVAPEFYFNRNPFLPEIQDYFKQNFAVMLPNESNSPSPRRLLITCKHSDPEKFPVQTIVKALVMLMDVSLYEDDQLVVYGQEVIIDFEGTHYNHAAQMTPRLTKCIALLSQDACPVRLKGIYVLNIPSFLKVAYNAITALTSKKIMQRLHLYSKSNFEEIYNEIPRCVFPEEYGGTAGSLSKLSNEVLHKLERNHKWFQEDTQYGTHETKRLAKLYDFDEILNMEGSFRKLEVD